MFEAVGIIEAKSVDATRLQHGVSKPGGRKRRVGSKSNGALVAEAPA